MKTKEYQRTSLLPGKAWEELLADRKAREGHNPHTGEKLQIPATRVPAFRLQGEGHGLSGFSRLSVMA
ncbi:HU family DNA-binding protein (plasmid) [Acaryochloris sp. CCMEE 5410]|nr:HU family DNA-binding protein [Acaryochloris sp. CCMEE 5410]